MEKKEEKAIVPFVDLNLHPNIEEGLKAMGFENATPIQSEAIPHVLNNKDVLGIAQTGTGMGVCHTDWSSQLARPIQSQNLEKRHQLVEVDLLKIRKRQGI